ncbi:MAG TPA: Ig-like domain-containing protein, partial [Gammaproteobacteria bacterium]|nr:Ig-like domain-containing protein [Gammaproteobacteria bacterium]
GYYLSLSSLGDTAAISAVGVSSGAGEVYVFSDFSGSWVQAAALTDPDATANDSFGNPISLSASGDTLLAGSSAAVTSVAHAGKAYLFTLNSGTWSQSQEFDDPANSSGDYFGGSGLSLTEDGLNAYIAASGTKVGGVASAGAGYLLQTQTNLTLGYNFAPVTSVTVGDSLTIVYKMTDGGSFSAGDSRLVLTLPGGVSFVSGADCSAGGSRVICGEFLVPPGGGGWTASITLKATAPGKMDILSEEAAEEAAASLSNSSFKTTITVADIAPTAKAGSVTTAEGQAVKGTLSATAGYSGQKLSYAVAAKPAHGTVSLTASTGAFTYTPASGYSGSDSFTFTAGDGTVSSSAATESITVTASGSSGGGGGTLGLLSLAFVGVGFSLRRRRSSGT